MIDKAHKQTDEDIEKTQRHLAVLYAIALRGVNKKLLEFAAGKKEADELYAQIGKAKTPAEKQKAQTAYRNYYTKLVKTPEFKKLSADIATDLTKVNQEAAEYINNQSPSIYANNYNAIGNGLQRDLSGYSFTPITEAEAEQYSGVEQQVISTAEDKKWNIKTIAKTVVAGAMLYKTVRNVFSDAGKRTVSQNRGSAYRQASDMATGAENLGRLDSMYRASDEGFGIRKVWVATLDNRTRDTHIEYDNLPPMELDYEYNTGLKEPKDPNCGIAAEVCNCRCRIVYDVGYGISSTRAARMGSVHGSYKNDSSFSGTYTYTVPNMTYSEWKRWHNGR